nr:esterase-like activity of phytase family protein [Actinophytocola gossypii]
MTDPRLAELSGLVADADGWYAVNDGGTSVTVYAVGRDCVVQREIGADLDPYDVEDLARAPDGTFWLSDTGDNDRDRETIALIALTPDGDGTLYRLTYPDGAHDAEALLLDRAGTPYVVTKSTSGNAKVYRPAAELTSPGPTPLELVGSVRISPTTTSGGPVPGFVGSVTVTGGATSQDGSVVALRTYTDAYLWHVDGDLVAALSTEATRVPLPDEAQGEAIAFEPDGTLVSASEGTGEPVRVVPGAADLVAPPPPSSPPAPSPEPEPVAEDPADDPTDPGLPVLPAAVVAVALVGGVFLLLRRGSRR